MKILQCSVCVCVVGGIKLNRGYEEEEADGQCPSRHPWIQS